MISSIINWTGLLLKSILMFLLPVVGPVLRPDDHYLLRYYAAINRVIQPVVWRVFELLRPQNGKTIKEILFASPEYTETKYKKCFSESEREKLDNDADTASFDITFLYKLIQIKSICGLAETSDEIWSETGSLENSLKRIKIHRNVLAHEDIVLTYEDLQKKFKDLKNLCKIALEKGAIKTKTDVNSDIKCMIKGLDTALDGKIDLWEPYRNALAQLRQEKVSVLLREGYKDIKVLGKNLRTLNPFTWLLDSDYSNLDVEHIFTEMEMRSYEKIDLEKLLNAKLSSGELPDTIVIVGPAGIGKTSIIRYLVQDWLSTHPSVCGMEKIDLVLPVELRYSCSNNVKDLLKDEILSSVFKHLKIDDVMLSLHNITVLWLLDGYDEADVGTRKVISEILRKFPNSRIVITTRTEYYHEIEITLDKMHRSFMKAELVGFSKNNIELCATKLIDACIEKESDRSLYLERFKKLNREENRWQLEIFSIPLYVNIIVLLWLKSPNELSIVKTRSGLYHLLVEHIINRLLVRDSYTQLGQRKSLLKRNVNRFLDELGKLLFKKEYDFSLQQYEVDILSNFCDELGLPFTDTMSAFFICVEVATVTGVREEYFIVHQTIMDFLIARAFCNQMVLNKWDVMRTAEELFNSTRDTLLQYEPHSPELKDKYNLGNLTRDVPYAIFQGIYDRRFEMSMDNFYILSNHCNTCDAIRRQYIAHALKSQDTKSFWCHIKNNIFSIWTFYLIGYLNLKEELTETRCEQLAFIYFKFAELDYGDFSILNWFVKEGQSKIFNEKLSKYIENFPWAFNSVCNLLQARELLKHITPKSVFLHYCPSAHCSEVDQCNNVISAIHTFMEYPLEIHLDLRYYLSKPESRIEFTERCLELLLGRQSSHCQLISVRCPVNLNIMTLLKNARNLRELTVKLNGESLSELIELINSLPELEIVKVAISAKNYHDVTELPVMTKDKKVVFTSCILVSEVFQVKPEIVGEIVGKLCLELFHVVLYGSIAYLNVENLLAYVFWILSNVKEVEKLEIVLDISKNRNLLCYARQLNSLNSFLKRIFPDHTIEIKLSISKTKEMFRF